MSLLQVIVVLTCMKEGVKDSWFGGPIPKTLKRLSGRVCGDDEDDDENAAAEATGFKRKRTR